MQTPLTSLCCKSRANFVRNVFQNIANAYVYALGILSYKFFTTGKETSTCGIMPQVHKMPQVHLAAFCRIPCRQMAKNVIFLLVKAHFFK